jgi:hypothetical protein
MWFRAQKTAKIPEPDPPIDRTAALLSELVATDSELATLNREALRLRSTYSLGINVFGEIVASQCDLRDVPHMQTEWRTLQKRLIPIMQRRNAVLAELAALKMGATHAA